MRLLATAASIALLGAVPATYADPFPLAASAGDTTPMEGTAPFVLSDGLTQTIITHRNALLGKGLAASFGLWDMSAFDQNSKNVFVPSEVGSGAGAFRYKFSNGKIKNLLVGNGSGIRSADPTTWDPLNDDYSRFDPATYTPNKTVLLGEETTGGRLFEIKNPHSNGPIKARWLSMVPAVAHEGLRFDSEGNLYFVDEDNSGSIYKYVPKNPKNLGKGQTFVLKVDAYTGPANESWNSAGNMAATRVGAASWVPMTNKNGVALTAADPFAYVTTTGGRTAADELDGTPYGRPEDITFKTLANGKQAFFFTATSEHTVYCVELTNNGNAIVRVFANRNTTDLATGAAVGPALSSPDNLATGADGTIYIIEDQEPGDVWKAADADNDGVAESIGRWISLGVAGAEPTGLEQDPNDPKRLIINVQHPDSGNDALWEIRLP